MISRLAANPQALQTSKGIDGRARTTHEPPGGISSQRAVHHEAVGVEIEAVRDRRAGDFGDEAARCGKPSAVDADPLGDRDKLMRASVPNALP